MQSLENRGNLWKKLTNQNLKSRSGGFREREGRCPSRILADRIYRNRKIVFVLQTLAMDTTEHQ